jgi:hypothetical protein
VAAQRIASDPVPMTTLRFRERRIGCAQTPSRPKAVTKYGVHERTSHDHTHVVGATNSSTRGRLPDLPEGRIPASRSRNRRHLPEVRCLSAESDMPIVTRWIASPAPSALRVSHPLSGLIPAHPRGCCFKPHPPIGFMGLQSFSRRGQPRCLSAPRALLPSSAP